MTFIDNFKIPLKLESLGIRLPKFKFSDEDYEKYRIPKDYANYKILIELCRQGYKQKVEKGLIPKDKAKEYGDRVKHEIQTLKDTNFLDYILFIFNIISFRDKRGFVKSYGRGSCAGSLVCHLIGITDCDPIKHGLFFQRFISQSRAKTNWIDGVAYLQGTLPDIDLDFSDEERAEVVAFLETQYPERMVKLSTTATYATKALTGDLCKVLFDWKKEDYEFLTKQVVAKYGKNPSPQQVIEESEVFKAFCEKEPMFEFILKRLHENIKSVGSHASAYAVSYNPLIEFMPMQYGKRENENGEDGELEIVSTYDMYSSEDLACKVDLLGLKALSVVGNVVKATGIDTDTINLDDDIEIYGHLKPLNFPHGLFQISGGGVAKCVNKVQPENLDELSVVTALARPGAMEFVDKYSEYLKTGQTNSLHPLFDDVLTKTGSTVVFQEQLLQMLNKLGFTLEECEVARRGVGKKSLEVIEGIKKQAYEKAEKVGAPKEAVDIAMGIAIKSADYSFNKTICPKTTFVELEDGGKKLMKDTCVGEKIKAFNTLTHSDYFVEVKEIFSHKADLYEVELTDGVTIICSKDHKFLCSDFKMYPLWRIEEDNLTILGNI